MVSIALYNQIEIWMDCIETETNSEYYYCQNLKVNKDKVVIYSDPNSSQKFCLTVDAFYHYSCGIWSEIQLIDVSNIKYNNGVINITSNQGKAHSYTVSSLTTNIGQRNIDAIGNAIVYVMRYLKHIIYGKNNNQQVP